MKNYLRLFVIIVIMTGFFLVQPGCKEEDVNSDELITGIRWILESFQYSAVNTIEVQDTFWIIFNDDFTFGMHVDCNVCSGTYQLGDNQNITLANTICTEAYCGDDSLDGEFHEAINNATAYECDGNRLTLFFNDQQSQLNFVAE